MRDLSWLTVFGDELLSLEEGPRDVWEYFPPLSIPPRPGFETLSVERSPRPIGGPPTTSEKGKKSERLHPQCA